MTILKTIVSVACDLFLIKDPYKEPYERPVVTHETTDTNGYPVLHVRADNYIDASDITAGTTYPGSVYREAVHIKGKDWQIRIKEFDTEFKDGD